MGSPLQCDGGDGSGTYLGFLFLFSCKINLKCSSISSGECGGCQCLTCSIVTLEFGLGYFEVAEVTSRFLLMRHIPNLFRFQVGDKHG